MNESHSKRLTGQQLHETKENSWLLGTIATTPQDVQPNGSNQEFPLVSLKVLQPVTTHRLRYITLPSLPLSLSLSLSLSFSLSLSSEYTRVLQTAMLML